MNEEEAKETLKTMKENIDKKYLKTRNSVAIETVLNLLENKDKIIDLMAIAISNEPLPTEEYCIFRNFDCPVVGGNRDCKDCIKQYFENKAKEVKI